MKTFTITVRDNFPFDVARVAGRPFKKGTETILNEDNLSDEIRNSPSLLVSENPEPEPEAPKTASAEGSTFTVHSVDGTVIPGTVEERPAGPDLGTAIGEGTPAPNAVELPVTPGAEALSDPAAANAQEGVATDPTPAKASEDSAPVPPIKPGNTKPASRSSKN